MDLVMRIAPLFQELQPGPFTTISTSQYTIINYIIPDNLQFTITMGGAGKKKKASGKKKKASGKKKSKSA